MKRWLCNVCGYVHEGEEPPAACPVCGVGPEEFSLLPAEAAPAAAAKPKTAKRWKCTVCDYIHEGEEPPDTCPVCGVGKEFFVLLEEAAGGLSAASMAAADEGTMNAALNEISYGLYVVSSQRDGRINGQTANAVFQLTAQPPQIAVCINKRNLTHEYILASGCLAVSVIPREDCETPKLFGYRSGRAADKYADCEYVFGRNGCPILKECVAYLEAEVIADKTVDVGTHTLFVARVTAGLHAADREPLTYAHYRSQKPPAAK